MLNLINTEFIQKCKKDVPKFLVLSDQNCPKTKKLSNLLSNIIKQAANPSI